MTIHKILIPKNQLGNLSRMLSMAQRFAPEAVEDATIKMIVEDDLSDEEQAQGLGGILYVDEATYNMAQQYSGPISNGIVDEIPSTAQDYFDL